ncbi:MAG: phosphate/phosphite/phosphonate ABC transporter substrate-binding protein [Desulfobacteraceae bacterium]|nr:phosphate/phosphite/phosphonate ABC transporter substrate-binding protein [Desulfobacteraceae bacterium]
MKKTAACIFVILVVCLSGTCFAQNNYKIGVLAKNGPVKALKMWKSTGEYLSSQVDGNFEVVPLDFDAVFPAIEKGEIDFFLINSSMFITAKVKYDSAAIATMINSRQGKPLKSFGGVIFTSEDNEEINSVNDLSGKAFMAVKKSSFGGWQMAYMELLNQGVDPLKDFSKLDFGGKHDNVVLAVQNGVADAGTVRTDTLERMAATGIIELSDFKIITSKTHAGFPFLTSTSLYPEWPLAKTKKTSDDIAQKVAAALKQLKADAKAAKDAKIVGWTDALDYSGVENLQMKLKVGAYK